MGTSIDEKALELMENEEPNCYSCKHYRGYCSYFNSEHEASCECVDDNFSEWVGSLEYFRTAIVYEGYTVTKKGE